MASKTPKVAYPAPRGPVPPVPRGPITPSKEKPH
jgi:hypothetical protein